MVVNDCIGNLTSFTAPMLGKTLWIYCKTTCVPLLRALSPLSESLSTVLRSDYKKLNPIYRIDHHLKSPDVIVNTR